MTAFSTEEHGMIRGLWGELETMNRSLTRLVELLDNQEQERKDADHSEFQIVRTVEVAPDVNMPTAEERLAHIKKRRRERGLCLLCGVSRVDAGEGCYKWAPVNPYVEVWAPHSWPEDEPLREQFDDEPEVRLGPEF